MEIQIDNLVRSIVHNLAQPEPIQPEVAAFFVAIGADGRAQAVAKRNVLESYAGDLNLSSEIRRYAQNSLDSLPEF